MNYYIWKDEEGNIIAWNQMERACQEPAIQVSKEDFIELGFYSETPEEPIPIEEDKTVWDEMAEAIREGIDSI